MPSREFPMLRCSLSSQGPGVIREGACVAAWAMLPYLVIYLVLGSVTKHKGRDRTDRADTLPAYHDRALSVLHPGTRAPGNQVTRRRRYTAGRRHRMIHLVGRPRSTE